MRAVRTPTAPSLLKELRRWLNLRSYMCGARSDTTGYPEGESNVC